MSSPAGIVKQIADEHGAGAAYSAGVKMVQDALSDRDREIERLRYHLEVIADAAKDVISDDLDARYFAQETEKRARRALTK